MLQPEHTPHRFFGSHSLALDSICTALSDARVIRIATAYFAASGYQCLQDVLAGKIVYLLVGREEGGRDVVEQVLSDLVDSLTDHPLERRTRAMRQLLAALEDGQLYIAAGTNPAEAMYVDARFLYHHAKLYIADETCAVVTSANMSYHGLVMSREAGNWVTDPADVAYFVACFDLYFEQAESITERLIERLRAYLEAYAPFEVYIRALMALYDLPKEDVPSQLPELAGYQRPVVARVLQAIQDYQGAMLIASTGLGKTVMAAHIVAYLRMQNRIDNVMVVCPAGLRETWRRFMRAAVTSSTEYSYHTLSSEDPARNYSVRSLEHDLRYLTGKTLVILDESHHMRNADGVDGERKLRYQRVEAAVQKQSAQLLMLTATPFSRGVDDVNRQLHLLPETPHASRQQLFEYKTHWSVEHTADLPELPPCAVLTTPSVVSHFSEQDAHGERFVVFSGGERRYFPRRLKFHTEVYDNPLGDLLVELLTSRLLDQQQAETPQPGLWDGEDWQTTSGRRAGFFNAEVMRQFCSSPTQVAVLFDKLRQSGGFQKMRFARQKELTRFVQQHRAFIDGCQEPETDQKLRRILDIVRIATPEKIVIFCHYVETAKALAQAINEHAAGVRAETTAERDIETVDHLLRGFAPVANDVLLEERDTQGIQVLVATGTLAEGYNLQDASIIINYDLPWTVLVLAQRMGRVLRPWHEPREITIYNFIPSTMNDTRLHMAMNWQQRLMERNQQHRSFADIPVLMEAKQQVGEEGLEMAALAQQLQVFDQDIQLDLDETMRFIQSAEKLSTSSFLDDLALLTDEDRVRVAALPSGFRSARLTSAATRLFVLFRQQRRYYAVLFDATGKVVQSNEERDAIMNIIRCERDEPLAPPSTYPDDDSYDRWLDNARLSWVEMHKLKVHDAEIVCSLALVRAT